MRSTGSQRAFGRSDMVNAAHRDQGHKSRGQPHHMTAIDNRFGRNRGQIVGGPAFYRLINARRQPVLLAVRPAAKQKKIHQAVLQRRPALFYRMGHEYRIDLLHKRTQNLEVSIRSAAHGQNRKRQQPRIENPTLRLPASGRPRPARVDKRLRLCPGSTARRQYPRPSLVAGVFRSCSSITASRRAGCGGGSGVAGTRGAGASLVNGGLLRQINTLKASLLL